MNEPEPNEQPQSTEQEKQDDAIVAEWWRQYNELRKNRAIEKAKPK